MGLPLEAPQLRVVEHNKIKSTGRGLVCVQTRCSKPYEFSKFSQTLRADL